MSSRCSPLHPMADRVACHCNLVSLPCNIPSFPAYHFPKNIPICPNRSLLKTSTLQLPIMPP
jgi:hypothetical protein